MLPVKILETTIFWCASAAMVYMVFKLVGDVKKVMDGNGSFGELAVKMLTCFFLIGIMFASQNFEQFGNMFGSTIENVVTEDNLPDIGQ